MRGIAALFLRQIAQSTRAVAAVEFALALPVLLLMYLGGAQLSDAIGCDRKVTITARAVADLISQNAILSRSQVNAVLNASQQIMAPYPSSNALVRVSEVTTDSNGNTTVTWSEAISGSARIAGSSFTVPAGIKSRNSSLIYSEVIYAYKPWITFAFMRPMTLTQTIYMVPRLANTVAETP